MFLQMSLCFMTYCTTIKHFLARLSAYQTFLLFISSSHSLGVQIPLRCGLPICAGIRKSLCVLWRNNQYLGLGLLSLGKRQLIL